MYENQEIDVDFLTTVNLLSKREGKESGGIFLFSELRTFDMPTSLLRVFEASIRGAFNVREPWAIQNRSALFARSTQKAQEL